MRFVVAQFLVLVSLVGCGPDSTASHIRPLDAAPTFAVLESDYLSSAVSLFDDEFQPSAEEWVHSGTTAPGLVAFMSGDVLLVSLDSERLLWLDRGNGTLSRAEFVTGEVEQFAVTLPAGGHAAYTANPQDAVEIAHGDGTRSYWVSRHEPNLDPSTPEFDRGTDLVRIDARSGLIEQRIDLSEANLDVEGERIYARPSRLVRVADSLVVGLGRLSLDFMKSGPGAVAWVDLATNEVKVLELPRFANCGTVNSVPGTSDQVLVSCLGAAFTGGEERRAGAGFVIVEVSELGLEVVDSWAAREFPGAPVPDSPSVPLSITEVVYISAGDRDAGLHDRLVRLDFATNTVEVVYTADDAFSLGFGVAHEGQAFVPASAPSGVLVTEGSGQARFLIEPGRAANFAPRQVIRFHASVASP